MKKVIKLGWIFALISVFVISGLGCTASKKEESINKYWSMNTKEYRGKFSDEEEYIEQRVKSNINVLKTKDNETLYEIKLSSVDGVSENQWIVGYFFLDMNKIYKLKDVEIYNENMSISDFKRNSSVVCSDNGTQKETESGIEEKIRIKGDTVTYSFSNNRVETGFFEKIVWKKGEGIISYRRGFGAERDLVEIE